MAIEEHEWQSKIFNLDRLKKEDAETRKRKLDSLRRDYQQVFSSPAGQRVFWDLLEQTYVFYPYEQYNASAYGKEGRRELGLYILAATGFSPDANSLLKLMKSLQQVTVERMEDKDD